jgi:hypothetical protein
LAAPPRLITRNRCSSQDPQSRIKIERPQGIDYQSLGWMEAVTAAKPCQRREVSGQSYLLQ